MYTVLTTDTTTLCTTLYAWAPESRTYTLFELHSNSGSDSWYIFFVLGSSLSRSIVRDIGTGIRSCGAAGRKTPTSGQHLKLWRMSSKIWERLMRYSDHCTYYIKNSNLRLIAVHFFGQRNHFVLLLFLFYVFCEKVGMGNCKGRSKWTRNRCASIIHWYFSFPSESDRHEEVWQEAVRERWPSLCLRMSHAKHFYLDKVENSCHSCQ